MKLMSMFCAITLSLAASSAVVLASPMPGESPTVSVDGPLGRLGPSEVVASSKKTYGIWCDPEGDDCYLTKDNAVRKFSRASLRAHIPMAEQPDYCSLEFCYNVTDDVIGLNPEYSLWKK